MEVFRVPSPSTATLCSTAAKKEAVGFTSDEAVGCLRQRAGA